MTFTDANAVGTLCNITVPKQDLLSATSPTVFINNQAVKNQGFTQDLNNFYVWYVSSVSTYELSIVFQRTPDFLFSIPVVIITIALVAVIILPKKGNNVLEICYEDTW